MPTPFLISQGPQVCGKGRSLLFPFQLISVELMAWACAGASDPGTSWATMRERQAELASKSPHGLLLTVFCLALAKPAKPTQPTQQKQDAPHGLASWTPAPKEWQLARGRAVGSAR